MITLFAEKTLQKLFQGAKKQQNSAPEDCPQISSWCCPHSAGQSSNLQDSSKKYTQMQIDGRGQLLVPNTHHANVIIIQILNNEFRKLNCAGVQ